MVRITPIYQPWNGHLEGVPQPYPYGNLRNHHSYEPRIPVPSWEPILQGGPHLGADGANLPEIPNDAMAVCGFRSPTLLLIGIRVAWRFFALRSIYIIYFQLFLANKKSHGCFSIWLNALYVYLVKWMIGNTTTMLVTNEWSNSMTLFDSWV